MAFVQNHKPATGRARAKHHRAADGLAREKQNILARIRLLALAMDARLTALEQRNAVEFDAV